MCPYYHDESDRRRDPKKYIYKYVKINFIQDAFIVQTKRCVKKAMHVNMLIIKSNRSIILIGTKQKFVQAEMIANMEHIVPLHTMKMN